MEETISQVPDGIRWILKNVLGDNNNFSVMYVKLMKLSENANKVGLRKISTKLSEGQ